MASTGGATKPRLQDDGARKRAEKKAEKLRRKAYRDRHAARLDAGKGNALALKLEFRIRDSNAGWAFHDRFLIFPQADGPALAWSLGTSVNSYGKQHHILQKVLDGELISRAFLDLWDALACPENLIWKTA